MIKDALIIIKDQPKQNKPKLNRPRLHHVVLYDFLHCDNGNMRDYYSPHFQSPNSRIEHKHIELITDIKAPTSTWPMRHLPGLSLYDFNMVDSNLAATRTDAP